MILKRFDLQRTVFTLFFIFAIGIFAQVSFASTISGFVYGVNQTPLVDVDIELLNENYQARGRTRTEGSGRYEFNGLADGNYFIRAMPFRYNYQDLTVRVTIITFNVRGEGLGNSFVTQDFYLQPKKGGIAEYELGVIFVQEIPKDARQAFNSADKAFLGKRSQEGVDELFNAIKIFPEYYDALYRMGKELYILEKYKDAWQFLLKATEVNPKSGPAFYYLGECFDRLGDGYQKAAITSLTHASTLIPNMPQVFYTLGKVERSVGKFKEAEEHLLKAKKLAKEPVAQIQKELAQLYGNDLKKYKEAADELELYLKAGKLTKEEEQQTKKLIESLRNKAQTKSS